MNIVMAEKAYFTYHVEPQTLDFTSRLKSPALIMSALNAAGADAHNKGFDYVDMEADDNTWVLSRMAIEVDFRPKQYSDYRIETWISNYNRLLSTRNFRIYDDEGRQFATMTSQWAMLNIKTRTSVDLTRTADVHDRYMVDDPAPCDAPCRLRGVATEQYDTHTVRYSDIDFNRHLNTVRYLELLFDRLPIDAIAEDRPFRLDVHFLHESRLGDTLRVAHEEIDGVHQFEISTEEHPCVRAALRWRA